MMKLCRFCDTEKDINEFVLSYRSPDNHTNKCKDCHNAYNKISKAKKVKRG